MDGVPHLTQTPIGPGEGFTYEFDAVAAGTFWYHPPQRSFEQVGRGLYGPVLIDAAEAPRVQRDRTWELDAWRLTSPAEIGAWTCTRPTPSSRLACCVQIRDCK